MVLSRLYWPQFSGCIHTCVHIHYHEPLPYHASHSLVYNNGVLYTVGGVETYDTTGATRLTNAAYKVRRDA